MHLQTPLLSQIYVAPVCVETSGGVAVMDATFTPVAVVRFCENPAVFICADRLGNAVTDGAWVIACMEEEEEDDKMMNEK